MTEKEKESFEDALSKLESLVSEIEEGKIGLEESIRRYEEAMGLLKRCRQVLSEAELKIQKLQTDPEGQIQAHIDPESAQP